VPPKEDGTKAPIEAWATYQRERPNADKIKAWYRNGRRGVGLVCGKVSKNLELFEFDDAETYDEYILAAEQSGLGPTVKRVEDGYCEVTPGGGRHWLYYCQDTPETTKLATRPSRTPGKRTDALIETKGEGGYVIIAPSCGRTHQSGRAYELVSGGLDTITTLSINERRALWELAQMFNVLSQQEITQARKVDTGDYTHSPGTDFINRASWDDVLTPHGWQRLYTRGSTTVWRRPGKREGASATTNYKDSGLLYVFTTSSDFDAGRGYNKFAAYTILNHGGDFHAAAAELRGKGYGKEEQYPGVVVSKLLASDDSTEDAQTRFTLHQMAEAFQPQPPIEWVVDGLYSRGSVNIIVGSPGSKKTYSTVDCALAVAMGDQWCGRTTLQGPVLLIDEESGIRRMNRRLRELAKGRGASEATPIWYTCLDMFNALSAGDIVEVDQLMTRIKPVLVVIDALADVMPGGDENSVKDTHPVFQNLRALAEKHHSAFVVIHHSNKTGGYRGSSAIQGAVDLMLMVESEAVSPTVTFTTVKARDTEPQSFMALIKFDGNAGEVTLSLIRGVVGASQSSKAEVYVIKYLEAHGSRAPLKDIRNNADICSGNAAKHAVYTLVERGIIRRCDGGSQSTAAEYELV